MADKLKTLKKLAKLGAIPTAAGVALSPEEAQAEEFSQFLKQLAKLNNKDDIAKQLQNAYNSPAIKNSPFLRDEYGKFIIDELKNTHPELSKANLESIDSLVEADKYIQNQLGTGVNTKFITKKDIDTDPQIRQLLEDILKKRNPNISTDRLAEQVDRDLIQMKMSRGFALGDNNNFIVTDKNKDIDQVLQTLVHEPFHSIDALSGQKLKPNIYKLDRPDELSSEAKDHLERLIKDSKYGLISDTADSIPEATGYLDWFTLDRGKIGELLLANKDPKAYSEYLKQSKNFILPEEQKVYNELGKRGYMNLTEAEKDQFRKINDKIRQQQITGVSDVYPEYRVISPSVGHSSNLITGIEHSLANDLLLKNIDPLDKTRVENILNKNKGKVAAGAAGVAALQADPATAAILDQEQKTPESPLDYISSILKKYRENVSEPSAKYLKSQMTPDLYDFKTGKTQKTSSPVTDLGIEMLADPINYVPGSPGAGLGALEFMSDITKSKDDK